MEEVSADEKNVKIGMDFEKPSRITKVENIKLIIKDDTHEAYANGLVVLHTSPMEFRLNFYDVSFSDDEGPLGIVKSTILVPPVLIRQMIKALEMNLKQYENNFGEIREVEIPKDKLNKITKFEAVTKKNVE